MALPAAHAHTDLVHHIKEPVEKTMEPPVRAPLLPGENIHAAGQRHEGGIGKRLFDPGEEPFAVFQQRCDLARREMARTFRTVDLLALNEALETLAEVDPQRSRIVELRFFAGLTIEETAQVMGVSPRTIDRQWQTAKAWLFREITSERS